MTATTITTPEADDLIQEYLQAKTEADAATLRSKALAQQIIARMGAPDEGQKTYVVGSYKLTIEQPVTTKIDWDAWDTVKDRIPEALHPIEMKASLDEKGVRWIRNNEPDIYSVLAQALTITPAPPSLSVAIRDKE